ncbi:DASH family cryptochrome [Undibacterium luofuense]|uniref:Cryptochrome DASH n=1 Tax=Undibacterium luofuense TaxID=2828733 RepID=A0A941DI05_9BURK|nr:DASH family cryptochrome [Undibacterium luofuense]MBR7781113.1 DASH family cryptochrome [Undibacterium luofuense]
MTALLWFRQDLRLHDHAVLTQALQQNGDLLPVFFWPENSETRWGHARYSDLRLHWLAQNVQALQQALRAKGSDLLVLHGKQESLIPELCATLQIRAVWTEDLPAPEEEQQLAALQPVLQQQGVTLNTVWHSSLLLPHQLPFDVQDLPPVFTHFRQQLENASVREAECLPAPLQLPPLPDGIAAWQARSVIPDIPVSPEIAGRQQYSSFPLTHPHWQGGEAVALQHLNRYAQKGLTHTYETTRNALQGLDFSSKWSPWLACGSLSPRRAMQMIREAEQQSGENKSTYWHWFELLWRDYFRFLHRQYGSLLYRKQGLSNIYHGPEQHDAVQWQRWTSGNTGCDLVDAGMRELRLTGYLSNRMRQIVASYWLNEMQGDWRAGAAWFEAQLLDFDVFSNQGNWLYISGHGTDPRGGRHFDIRRQIKQYDSEGNYRRCWGTAV